MAACISSASTQVAHSNQTLWADTEYKYHEIFKRRQIKPKLFKEVLNFHSTAAYTIRGVNLNPKFTVNLRCNIPIVIFNEVLKTFQSFHLITHIIIIIIIVVVVVITLLSALCF
jgi:hypothetical protein